MKEPLIQGGNRMSHPSKKTLILRACHNRWRSMRELNNICFAYSQRIGDLVREGWTKDRKRDDRGCYWYRLRRPNRVR